MSGILLAEWVAPIYLTGYPLIDLHSSGLGYFIVAVVAQALNLSFLLSTVRSHRISFPTQRSPPSLQDKAKQGTMLTLQTVITSILAQRISENYLPFLFYFDFAPRLI